MEALIAKIEASSLRKSIPDFRVGDIVRVHQRIREGGKERIQVFEGMVIAKKHGAKINGTFTVRRMASGVGVERIYPIHSPAIAKIERLRSSKVRRAKLYFLRELFGKKAKLKGWEAYASWEDSADEPVAPTVETDTVEEATTEEIATEAEEAPVAEEQTNDEAPAADGQPGQPASPTEEVSTDTEKSA